ncbi:MAG: Ribosomal protein S5 containing protein, expressed [Candidatus Roizmanbacteria bacterium GW2011_GWA2_37_7]|uniref:Small ribosomal subunit protein uS5 n=1 Tax=Candidatus Roizmanbacteria bacterium GW2011_GWA2_37_7 TaxID=1618481 RepID=A0A0G0H847_9BACT|nr:MAG: Ribosomal protein S5 containing protein, expressed [Candidatus Roizmanbacteria bacterium GW2011_GWA2_37_7]
MIKRRQKSHEDKQFDERVLHIRRVSKKTTGGNYVSFSALVAVGDGKGNVGIGIGRGLLKPAPPGTGLKLGGVVRVILDIAGVSNASGKIIGTRNQITNAYAVIEAIKKLKPRMIEEKIVRAVKKIRKPKTSTKKQS